MSKKVLFFVPFGEWLVHNQVDAVLALALQLRNVDIKLVGCDGVFKSCDILVRDPANQAHLCSQCARQGAAFFNAFNLPLTQLREYITPQDRELAISWADSHTPAQYRLASFDTFKIGNYVRSSIHSYFRITDQELLREDVIPVYRQYLINGALTFFGMRRIINDYNPTNFVIFNARFGPHRVVFELARSMGISTLMHERGYADDTFFFFANAKCTDNEPFFSCHKAWVDVPLAKPELQRVEEYLSNRERGKDLNVPGFYDYTNDAASIRHALRIPVEAKVLGMFTSTESEVATSDELAGVNNQLDVLKSLFEVFRARPDDYLVIRHHPSLAASQTAMPEYKFIESSYELMNSLPPNVRIIMPHEQINTYSLLWTIDACIALYSTVGLEAPDRSVATAGLEVAPFSLAHKHRLPDVTIQSLSTVVDQLFLQSQNFSIDDLRPCYRFLYTLIARISTKLKSCGYKDFYFHDIRARSTEELKEGHDPVLDRICSFICNDSSLYPLPIAKVDENDHAEEDQFLAAKIEHNRRKRAIVKQATREFKQGVFDSPVALISKTKDSKLPAWIKYSRCQNISYTTCQQSSGENIYRLLLNHVDKLKEHFVLVSSPALNYDSAFLSIALDKFHDDSQKVLGAIVSGAWLFGRQGTISGEVLTRRTPVKSYSNLIEHSDFFAEPFNMLGLCLFRRDHLLNLLRSCVMFNDDMELANYLFEEVYISGDRTELPMVLLNGWYTDTARQKLDLGAICSSEQHCT